MTLAALQSGSARQNNASTKMPEDGGIGGGILSPRIWFVIAIQMVIYSLNVPPPLPVLDR